MTVRVECSTIPREALQKEVRANRVQARDADHRSLAVSEAKKATDKALKGVRNQLVGACLLKQIA